MKRCKVCGGAIEIRKIAMSGSTPWRTWVHLENGSVQANAPVVHLAHD